MINRHFFNFYGVGTEIRSWGGEFDEVQKRVGQDFLFFTSLKLPTRIELHLIPIKRFPLLRPKLPKAFKTKMCQAYGFFGTRLCDYGPDLKVITRFEKGKRVISVFGSSIDALSEIALIALLSAVGEELDLLGLHRVHGLAYVRDGKSWLLPLVSGGGKSSIAALMLGDFRYQLLSDEIPLLGRGQIHPFPLRLALLPAVAQKLSLNIADKRVFKRRIFPEKILIPVPPNQVAQVIDTHNVILTQRDSKLLVIFSMVLGLGVPQFAEYMIRVDNLPRLARIALFRLVMATHLFATAHVIRMKLSPVPQENKSFLDQL